MYNRTYTVYQYHYVPAVSNTRYHGNVQLQYIQLLHTRLTNGLGLYKPNPYSCKPSSRDDLERRPSDVMLMTVDYAC